MGLVGRGQLTLLALLATAVFPAVSRGDEPSPPCEASVPPVWHLSAPAKLAFGQMERPAAHSRFIRHWDANSAFQFAFTPADPSAPISYGYSAATRGSEFDEIIHGPPLQVAPGDGVGRVTLSWTQEDNYSDSTTCAETTSQDVKPFPGDPPRVHVLRSTRHHTAILRIAIGCSGEPKQGRITVAFDSNGVRRSLNLQSQCANNWNRRHVHAGNQWRLTGEPWSGRLFRSPSVEFRLKRPALKPRRFHFRVRLAGATIDRGSFVAVSKVKHSVIIRQGSDSFVNYCIDGDHTIYSSGGKLYCYVPHRRRDEFRHLNR